MRLELTQGPRLIATVANELPNRPDILGILKATSPLGEVFDLPNDLPGGRLELYRRAYFGIGDTECYRVNLPNDNRLLIKMEYTNAMGNTHYSRFWLVHLFIAEVLGVIHPDSTRIIEVTSGSSGIALAMAAEVLGYDVTILVPSLLPEARVAPMRRRNITIQRVDGYVDKCIAELRRLVKQEDYFATNHSEERADVITHVFSRIGHEIARDVPHLDSAIIAMGNGTSTQAVAGILKQKYSGIHISAYRPKFEEAPKDIVFGLIAANVQCRHIANASTFVDHMLYTTGVDIQATRERFAHDTEIANLGPSSLYGVGYALSMAEQETGKTTLTIGYDKIDRY